MVVSGNCDSKGGWWLTTVMVIDNGGDDDGCDCEYYPTTGLNLNDIKLPFQILIIKTYSDQLINT